LAPFFIFEMAESLHNIKLVLTYDGSRYHGWQRQPNGITVQEVIEEKIQMMAGDAVTLIASGRTDAGVHAINQVCNFKTRSPIDPAILKKGLNSLLPDDILVIDAEYVSLDFHARYDAKTKTYEYRILNREEPDIFQRKYVWHIRMPLDAEEMRKCVTFLSGTHNFSCFRSSGSGNMNPVRSVINAGIYGPQNGQLRFVIEADGFLRHMVRNIVGTLVEAGLGKINSLGFKEIIESKDRNLAGVKAPPQGLFLMKVRY
jgi:tRNA pseudouridine38-40 synthase